MRTQRSNLAIRKQTNEILTNIANDQKTIGTDKLRDRGHVLFSEASVKGFKKVGWDVYQRSEDIDAGNIWSVEEVDGDKWLVCYTDANDQILRNLSKAASNLKMKKIAASITPAVGWGLKPGDLAIVAPKQNQSFNYKHDGLKGVITAAMPDRTQLTFGDGSRMWFENKDLTLITDSKEMELGDDVRMFANNISGRVTKISRDSKYVTLTHNVTGQEFTARASEVIKKKAFVFMWTGDLPEDSKAAGGVLNNFMKTMTPQDGGGGGEMGGMPKSDNKPPPSIKQNPSAQEMSSGTSMPAGEIGPGLTPGGMPQSSPAGGGTPAVGEPLIMAAVADAIKKIGRRMNIGDSVQKKSTGQKGMIVDVSFDRKLGKFYLIDFGEQQPEQVYETDLMKLKEFAGNDEPAPMMPTEVTPGPTRMIGSSVKNAVLDPAYNSIKDAAREFVNGMVSQALTIHESEYPGNKPTPELEEALTKQAITTYMAKYLPEQYRQVMANEDKNDLSEWLLFELHGGNEDAPTSQEFVPGENTTIPAQTPQTDVSMAQDKISQHMRSHIKFAKYIPGNFVSPIEKNRFIRQAVSILKTAGIDMDTARLVTASIMANNSVDNNYLRHQLINQLGYGSKGIDPIIDEVTYQLATTLFVTAANGKYALDLPGMETLRGGGGGYPGGMDVDPMGWDVKSPNGEDQDPNALQQSLEEQLGNQSKPFEEAAPELNIKLDQENQQIVIDYKQKEDSVIPLEGVEGDLPPGGEESPNMPNPQGPAGQNPGGPGAGDFNNQDVPVNF